MIDEQLCSKFMNKQAHFYAMMLNIFQKSFRIRVEADHNQLGENDYIVRIVTPKIRVFFVPKGVRDFLKEVQTYDSSFNLC